MTKLTEAYKARLAVADKVYADSHRGQKLTESKKIVIAKVLNNTNKFLNEAFNSSVGTNRSDMGLFKKFALNLTNVAMPNLIAFDLVIVHPMSSMSGYINYIQYVAGSTKGATNTGDVFNDPFRLGKVDTTYTSSAVVDNLNLATSTTQFAIKWAPVVPGSIKATATSVSETYYNIVATKETVVVGTTDVSTFYTFADGAYTPASGTAASGVDYYDLAITAATVAVGDSVNGLFTVSGGVYSAATGTAAVTTTVCYDDGNGKLIALGAGASISKRFVATVENADGTLSGTAGKFEVATTGSTSEVGTVNYGLNTTRALSGPVYDSNTSAGLTFTNAIAAGSVVELSYNYNNVVIPQNDLPILSAQMKAIPLIAKARRIAVYYSQIAAFQAKTDYDMDLGEQLAEKAVGQLSYEIDTEIVNLLDTTAGTVDTDLRWNRNLPNGVSKAEHYEGFTEIVAIARQKIYDRTKRFAPNYMIIASDILPVLGFAKGWDAAPAGNINGPYFAGTLDGLKVFVSPMIAAGRFVIGVNGNDMMSSVAVYAPYMPIVPTQLLNFSDGANTQGWSTLYALEVLNKDLIIAGEVYRGDYNTYYGAAIASSIAG